MGNTLGCVKEPKEQAGEASNAPFSPKRKARFKRKRRGKKRMVPKEGDLVAAEAPKGAEEVEEMAAAAAAAALKKFRAGPLQEEGEDLAENSHPSTASHGEARPSWELEGLDQGHVVQVRERFQGQLEKAHLVTEEPSSGSSVPGGLLEEGTMVIARLLDNPAEQNRDKVASRLVAFQRPGSGNSRAILVPLQRAPGAEEAARECEEGTVVVCRSWEQPPLETPATVLEETPAGWNSEEGDGSLSSATWGVEKGTVSELSTPSPMADQTETPVPGGKAPRLPCSQEPPVGKWGESAWAKLPASQSKSSFSGSTSSTLRCSSGYGSDTAHQQAKASGAGRHSGPLYEDCPAASVGADGPKGRTKRAPEKRHPAEEEEEEEEEEGISDIYISGESGDMSAKEKLLLWTQKVTAGYVGVKCTNFSSCWSDGKMFNAIIHRYRPDLVDMERVQIQSSRDNLEQAFEIAERLGVTRLLDAEDVDVPSPDEKSVITYVSSIYDAFPKVPEGGEGISATEVDTRWLEYQNHVESLISWIKQHTITMSGKSFSQNPVELKALYNQYIHFKETEIPAKQQEKGRIEELYKLLEVWIEFGRFKLPQGYHPNDVEEEWGKLIIEMLEREKLLRPAVERLELLLQIANRIQHGTLSCEEKLTLARNTLQADEAHLESGQPVQYESDVAMYLQECEGLLRQLQADVQILRDENYYQLEELVFKIVRLQDELVTLRLECTNLYRKGHFSSPSSLDLVQPSSLSTMHLKTEPLLKGTHSTTTTASTSWFRKPMTRMELVAISSSEDEGSLRFVYELLSWVEEMQMKLERAEWGSDLPSVDSQLEAQRHVHTSVEELGASVKEARMYEGKMSQNFRTSYTETLGKLETQYGKLMETSSFRLRHLQSLYGFVSQATAELIWLNEKEEEELAYDWSDNNPSMAAKRNYFSELTLELEEKQDVFRSLQDTAEILSLENHPAKQTVEAYSAAVQTQWQWIKQLCLCVDQHVKENTAYFQFFTDARDSETYLKNLQDTIKRKYSCDRSTSLTRLEDLLQDSMDEKEQLIQSKSSVASLVGRSKAIVQLKPRNPDHVLKNTISVKAICDYRQIEITISKNDECVLEDNSQRTKWKVISPTGNEAMVPSVCFLVPPPNKEAIDMASRVEQLYQKVMALWHQLHINMKSLVSWNYLRKDLSLVQSWNIEKLRALAPGECHQSMKSLQVHYEDFLEDSRDSELFSVADRLRLEEEVGACKELCQQLLQSMENEDKDETASRTYLSELKNIRLHLEECEQRLVGTIRTPCSTRTDGDALQENTFRIAEQERLKADLQHLKTDTEQLSERCNIFLHKSPTGSSIPHLRSELNLLVEKMDHVYGLSSIYLDKLKTVDVIIRNTQGAESLVKGYEVKLSQEEAVPADLATIQSHRAMLKQWISEVSDKNAIFATLEDDLARAKVVADQLYRLKQERSLDLERYQEKGSQLWDRWQRVSMQVETRQSELESIEEVLSDYRNCHGALIQWIEETTTQQELMKPGQAEDSRILSEQLSQQMVLFAEIEGNQAKLDQCQKLSQHYSSAVKDYELQLMTYRAFVESQQKSPVKRRRMLSSSDAITQEFMDLRTRYTALVTLTTQHVKYISDALRRLEEEEKVVEEEKQEHVDKVKELLGWVMSFKQSAQFRGVPPKSKELGNIEKSILEQQVLNEELAAKKEQVSEAIKTAQIFLAKHSHKLPGQEKAHIDTQLSALKETYEQLCTDSTEQLQQLQTHMAQETAHKDTEIVSGVLDLGTMEVLPVLGAMQKGLIDQETGLVLLEAQVITGGLVVPKTSEKLSLAEGLARGIIDCRTHQLLQELQNALQLVDQMDLRDKTLLPVVLAVEDRTISESLGLKILAVQLVAGGLIDSSSQVRIGLEEALQRGIISTHLHEKLASHLRSCKNLIDPNSARKVSLRDLMQQCILHQETGLRLLPVEQLAGGMVSLKSGRKVNIFRAVQEGLIEKQVTVRLLEAQLFAGGIVDPKSGHRLAVDEAIRHNLIDQDLACSLLVRQLQTGGIIDTVTGERLSLDEAVRRDLVTSRVAVVILESLWSLMGLLWPESGEILSVADALEQGVLSSELAHKILSHRQHIKALFMPEAREVLPWQIAIERGILSKGAIQKLQSICLPDVMPDMPLADSPNRHARSTPSSESPPNFEDQNKLLLRTGEERMLFSLMTHSYVDIHSGQKLLLVDGELSNLTDMLVPELESGSSTHLLQASRTHPQDWDVSEGQTSKAMEAKPYKEMALKELALGKELEGNLLSNICSPNESVGIETGYFPKQDAENSRNVKDQVRECDPVKDFMIEMDDSKKEQEPIMFQSRREIELPASKSIMDSSFEIKARNVETTWKDVMFAELPAKEKMIFKDQERISKMRKNDAEKEISMSIGGLEKVEASQELPAKEKMIFKDQERISKMRKNDAEKEISMSIGSLEKVEASQGLKEKALEKIALVAVDGDAEAMNWLDTGKVENGSVESRLDQAEVKATGEHMNEGQSSVEGGGGEVQFHQTDGSVSPKLCTESGEDNTLKMLLTQLQNGGIIQEQTSKKMLLDEAIACGIVPSHTAIKLMGAMKIFSGFFDAETCESLTTEEVIGEGLMDEKLLQKVLASDQAISGVIDPLRRTIYSVKDASEVGLLDRETAERILEGQVVTGGIVDFKRGKKMSVTLASKLGLIQRSSQEDLKKLEKACKGKGTEEATKEKLITLQAEIGGILDPKTKEPLTVTQAVEKGFLAKETAFQLLTKQIADGGILHHKTGMRLSVEDAMEHGLINEGFYKDLSKAESVCFHQCVHPETKELLSLPQAISLGVISSDFQSKVQEIQTWTGSIFDPRSGQKITLTKAVKEGLLSKLLMEKAMLSYEMKHSIINPESCRLVPYSELVRKSKIDIETGQRYLEIVPFREVQDEATGDVISWAQAAKLGKVDRVPSLRLLQAQADRGGIMETSTGQRISLASALELEVVDEDIVEAIAINQVLTGGIVDIQSGERVTLKEAMGKGLVSKKLASRIQASVRTVSGGSGLEDLEERKGYEPQLLLQNGTEILALHNHAAESPVENQRAVPEAVDSSTPKEAREDTLKRSQETSQEMAESAPPSLPFASALESLASQLLGEGSLSPELSLMLDPDATRVVNQKKKRKSKLKGKELWKEELDKQAGNDREIKKTLERIVSQVETSVPDGMLNQTINGGQEETESKLAIGPRAQEEREAVILACEVTQGDMCLEPPKVLAPQKVSPVDHREEEKTAVIETKDQVSDEILPRDTKSELPSPGSKLKAPVPNASEIDLKPSKKKKTQRNRKQDTVPAKPLRLHESSQGKPSLPIPDSKEGLMRRLKEELISGVQESVETDASSRVAMRLAAKEPTEVKREDKQAFGTEKKQLGVKENITDDQKVNITPKTDAPRELTEPETRTDQDSFEVFGSLEERESQDKAKEPFMSTEDQIPKVTTMDDSESIGPFEPEMEALQFREIQEDKMSSVPLPMQEIIVQEAARENGSIGAKGLPVAAREDTQQVEFKGGEIIGLKVQKLQEEEFPQSKRESSRMLPLLQNAALEMNREAKNVGEGVEDGWQETPKPAKTLYSKQLCLDYDGKLVAHLSRVRGIEMRIQRVQLADLTSAALQDMLRQAQALDRELKNLSVPVDQELEAVKGIVASSPQEVPEQLLKALEKDAKNLQKSFGSVSEAVTSWLHNLHAAVEAEKMKIVQQHENLQRKLQELLNWVVDTTQLLDGLESQGPAEGHRLNACLQSYKELREPLTDTKAQLDAAAFDIQFFISEHAQDLTPAQSRQLLRLLNELQRSFRDVSERVSARAEVLQVCLQQVQQTDQTLQEQQAIRSQKLEEVCTWLNQAESRLVDPQGTAKEGDLSSLQQRQKDVKELQRSMHCRAASFASILKATEEFLEENGSKLDPRELASLQERLCRAKEQYQSLQERTEAAQQELESAVSTVVQQQTEKVKAAKDLEENQSKIDSLLHWVASLEQTPGKLHPVGQAAGGHREGRVRDALDGPLMETDRVEEDLDLHYEGLKARHQELVSQQQEVILASQSAQAFLGKQGHNLMPEEKQRLQGRLGELKGQYAAALSQSEARLKQAQALRDELQKFLRDHVEFEAWLGQAEQALEKMYGGDGSLESLRPRLLRQSSFSEDVISHKGDLRFVTMSGQKVLDAEKVVAGAGGPEALATGALVRSKLDGATKRYGALHSKCTVLGSHLNMLLDRSQQFQDVAESLRTWLRGSEEAVAAALLEPVSSDPTVLQRQLASSKRLQEDLAEHQVPVEKLEKAARSLLEIQEAPLPDHRGIRETTDSIVSRFQALSCRMAERSDVLQKSIAQSQSVQEGLENLLQSMSEIERNLQKEDVASFSSTSIQESLATNMKLKQDIARQNSSLEATREMVNRFMATADRSTAAALQSKLAEVTGRFGSLCRRQQEKEDLLKDLLPKVEQYEQLSERLQQFTESRARLLASGNQPDRDIAHFSQQLQELNSEMKQHHEDLDALERVAVELSSCGFSALGGAPQLQEKVRSMRKDFTQLQKAVRERERGASSCQDQLDEFRKLVGSIRKWLKETEGNIPATETSVGTQELEKRMQQIEIFLEEWTEKGILMGEINRRGTALENLIVEITSPDAQSRTGSVLPAVGGSVGSVNGYHTCKDLTEIQCDVSDVNLQYEGLGAALRERQEELSAMLAKMRAAQEEASSVLKWLESKERALAALEASSSPTQSETMRAQAEQNKVFLAELEQNAAKVQKAKESLSGLLEKYPESPEAGNWKRMLEDLNSGWAHANQVTADRQQKLEKSANELASFQVAESQLRPWLMEKELMMSVLGPLSIDPNMLNAQKQQVQFMLKEFEARKQQYDQLNEAAQGILASPGDASPSSNRMQEELRAVNQKWTELTDQLNSRSSQIDQATVKSTQYQELIQGLSEKVKAAGQRLSSQPSISTQPEAVKQQLEETSEIRSDLGQLEEEITEAQALCEELSVLMDEQYLRDELKKRLETVALPLKGLEDLAGDRMNRLQMALASSQQFQQMFDELHAWLDERLRQQAQSGPISAKLEKLQHQIQEQEESQKSLNQHSGSYEMIVVEGESLLLSVHPGEEKAKLQGQLVSLKASWEELSKQIADRHSKLKDCMQKAQKYQRHVEDLLPWVEDCRSKMLELEVTLDPVQLEATLLRSKALLSDVEKRRSLLEMLNSAADILINASQMDEDDVRDEKAGINQKMDAITEELQAKTGSLEEMSQRLKEFQESFRNIEKKLEGTKHQLEIYEALGPQACSSKNLEKLRTQQEVLQALEPQVDYLRNFTQGLVEDAPDGSDSSHLLRQAEVAQQDFKAVKQKVNECCVLMESKLEGIGQFNNHVREMFSQLADLDDELDSMGPVGRDMDSLQSQAEDVHEFLDKLQRLRLDIQTSEETCRQMLEDEGSPDLIGLKRELETLNKQCGKLTERGKSRLEQVEMTLARVKDFYNKLKELNCMTATAEENEALQWVVGTEVEVINQQLADFKTFQKEQVDPLQLRLQQVNGVGQGLIQSAGKNCDVQGLEHDMEDINARWNTLNKKVAQRIAQLQEALLHCGKFQDALEPLLSWLADTEELISNQKPPSAEYKVVKAQIQEQKLLQRLLDDRKATVEMIQAEGGRIAQSAEPADREKIVGQLDSLGSRWAGLLSKATARQNQLEEILVLAKQFHETSEPISDWLTVTEKKLSNSEPIGTQTGKIQQQITRHKVLEEDIDSHAAAVTLAVRLGQSLASLSCRAEQASLADKLDLLESRYDEIYDRSGRKAALLDQALSNARLFGEDEVEVLNWLAEVEDKLTSVSVRDYKRDVLQKQHADQLALNDEIVNRKKNVDQAIKNGQALLKQTTGEEVLLIQEKLDGIKTRYSDITAASSKALRTLEQARQLATKFQSTHEELAGWMGQVEEELTSSGGHSPVGEEIPQFQQRQKELKTEVMERRLILDTVNEVSRALLELVPWRAREGLDKLVSDTNERYKLISDTIKQRVEEIDAAIQRSQQYEQAADAELAWVAETKRKLMALGPIRLEQDQTTAQLQVQKAFSIDIIRHKDSVDELLSQRSEIFGTCGDEQKAMLQEKTEALLKQYDEISHLNSERYARLERAQVLVNQFWETYEELSPWLEETQVLLRQLPPLAIDHEHLKQQQEDMRQLRESIAEHKPHIDKLLKIGPQLKELNPEEGEMVQEKYSAAEATYSRIKEEVRQRALALDEAVSQSTQFHDKIEPMLETLKNLSTRLRVPPLIPAEVEKIRECISDNKNATMELEKLQPSFEALKRRGEELIGRSQGADRDLAAKEIQDKLDQMVFFWENIKARAEEREIKFLDVLELAEKFWYDMAALLTTIRDTQDIVHDLESPGIDPSIIKQQVEAAETIKEETDSLHEELEFIRILGADLIFACGETEKPEVKKSIDEMNSAWENLNKTWKERLERLEEAMQSAVQYQDTLQAMFDWLDNTVIKLCNMPPVGTDLNTVKEQLNEMKEFKLEVYQQQIEMEKLNHQGGLMLKKATDETDRDIIREPLMELKHLWENLGDKIAQRQHKLEGALLALGQFQHALAELMAWLTHTEELLDAQKPINGDPKVIEVELAKHHVLKNDVLAHQATVETVNKAGNELLESSAGDDASSLRNRLESMNSCWESVLQKTEVREQQLQMTLQQAQGFHGEIEDFLLWLTRMESQLSASKPTGGLPETAREQLNAHMELYAQLKANEEVYSQLLAKGRLMLLSRDDSGSGSKTEQSVALLEQKWSLVSTKLEERKSKLEEALGLATEFQNSLQDFINWLTLAEQSLNLAPPPSLILHTVLSQIEDHKVFANEVNAHRDQIIGLDQTGNQLKFLSQKQDVVLIKNLLVSVQSRWEKVVQRSVERGRALDDARKRAKQFHEAWKKLIDWLEDAENHLDSELEISNDPDKIKLQLSKHKEFQKTLGGKQPVYDTTIRTGRALKEKAQFPEDTQSLDHLLGEVRDKWDTVCGKSVERQHKLEEALLFSGQFMDALQALVDWLYKVEPQLAEDLPVHGDLDLVMNLMDAHKVFQKELGKRTGTVQVLKRSGRELIENSRDDTTWVKVQLQELSNRWDTVCKMSVLKQTRLEQALKQAEEFRAAVHVLLEWLSEAEQTLRFRGALPDDAEALQSLIDVHKEFMKKVEEKRLDVNAAVGMGEVILAVCHPDCITTIKHWITIIRARFEEVLTWAKQHQQRLETALSELVANAELLEELLAWIQWAETTLIQRDQEPMPQNIEQVKALIVEHQSFMEVMTRKQPDVDRVTKTYKRKATEPAHGPFTDKSRSNRKSLTQPAPPPMPILSQSEAKNPRINQLSARWQQVWLLALERQRKLNDALDRLEELKEFANFDFDVWRKKYMRWMNHKKSRVMDFFRRIDKDQDGKITRQEFIDGILASKFPTTKLEMTAVADIFDRDGDGYIDYYEFVAALHPNKDAYRPTTDADKIEDEVTRQVAQCKCAKRFQVEQIGENKYRFFLGNQFGDSQQLRLVRILRSTVMVRVGGGWMALDEFLVKNDPCRVHHPGSKIKRSDSSSSIASQSPIARGRTNLELREKFILPEGASQGMAPFRSRGRRSKPSSRAASPTRSSSSASQSNHSCTSMPSSPATPASGNKVAPSSSSKLKRPTFHSSRTSLAGDTSNSSSPVSSGAKTNRADPKKTASRPTSRAGSRAGSRASSRRGSDASDFDLLETQSACSDTSESSATGGQSSSRRGGAKPSKIPTMSKKTTTGTPKTPGPKR
ncbi:microtubule-actin cross-linking factor 1 isoform X7 [Hemicordylus capensis]|uniref:microtubule-actin cross-linking factor 1 isoform X7 n=1 Tax=Hemicordylus capensis TaxID=884348 RepID=UPI002302DD45|nr:microtubule-actin cross-linking factor 1 isoform X7 [Hemicordylus capensis]